MDGVDRDRFAVRLHIESVAWECKLDRFLPSPASIAKLSREASYDMHAGLAGRCAATGDVEAIHAHPPSNHSAGLTTIARRP